MLREYFLYRHIRLDKNEPFYIGIGVKPNEYVSEKIEFKRAFEKTNRNKHWKSITHKTNYKVEILFESNDENVIKEKEKEFIELYKRKDCCNGTLVNMTDGGDGSFGRKWSDEFKTNFIEKNSGQNHYNYGKKLSEDTKRKKSESMKNSVKSLKGQKLPDWWCEKISEAIKGENNPMYGKTGELHHGSKKLINMNTFEIHMSMKDASEKTGYSFKYISENLLRNNNYTPFVLYSDYLEKGEEYCKSICNMEKKNKNQGTKKVINTTTGEVFESMQKAAESIGMNGNVFRNKVKDQKINFKKYEL